jgi:hypothetical protein
VCLTVAYRAASLGVGRRILDGQEDLVLARLEQALENVVGSVDDEIVTDSQLEFAVWDRVKIAGPLDGQHLDAVLP